jgi:hypothetical protein
MTTRRSFISGLLAASTVPSLTWADAGNPKYLSAARRADGTFALFGLSSTGKAIFQIPIPDRGHAATVHPDRPYAVAFARRPGRFALVINCATGQVLQKIDAPSDRHFYGHGTFAQYGSMLCTTENDIETGNGIVGLWSVENGYKRIGEISSGGIGPHDIKVLKNQNTLVIANGGIRTRPETGRQKLNLDTMRSNLHFVDLSGNVTDHIELPQEYRQNSIRHLALSDEDKVAFAMQWQGDQSDIVPLHGVWAHNKGATLSSVSLPEQPQLKNYVASIAFSKGNVGLTSSVGGRIHIYDKHQKLTRSISRPDVSGITGTTDGFICTDGSGGIIGLNAELHRVLIHADLSWDNHLINVSS